jgi:hypothetical protein
MFFKKIVETVEEIGCVDFYLLTFTTIKIIYNFTN